MARICPLAVECCGYHRLFHVPVELRAAHASLGITHPCPLNHGHSMGLVLPPKDGTIPVTWSPRGFQVRDLSLCSPTFPSPRPPAPPLPAQPVCGGKGFGAREESHLARRLHLAAFCCPLHHGKLPGAELPLKPLQGSPKIYPTRAVI